MIKIATLTGIYLKTMYADRLMQMKKKTIATAALQVNHVMIEMHALLMMSMTSIVTVQVH